MSNIWFHPAKSIEKIASSVAKECFGGEFDASVRAADPRFADFQINGALPFAKKSKKNPREVASNFVEELKKSGRFDESLVEISIAGPGFVNFKLSAEFLLKWLGRYKGEAALKDAAKSFYNGKKVVIDFPSPNTAKQMHVGHLRPMVIFVSLLLPGSGENAHSL